MLTFNKYLIYYRVLIKFIKNYQVEIILSHLKNVIILVLMQVNISSLLITFLSELQKKKTIRFLLMVKANLVLQNVTDKKM